MLVPEHNNDLFANISAPSGASRDVSAKGRVLSFTNRHLLQTLARMTSPLLLANEMLDVKACSSRTSDEKA